MKITISALINMFDKFEIDIRILFKKEKGYIYISNVDNDKDYLFYSLDINEILVDNDLILCSANWMNLIEKYIDV